MGGDDGTARIDVRVDGTLVTVTLSGDFGLADLLAIDEKLRGLPGVGALTGALVDLRGATLSELAADDLRAYAREPAILPAAARRGIVANTDQTFGLARMFEQLYAENAPAVRVFRDAAEARRWVAE